MRTLAAATLLACALAAPAAAERLIHVTARRFAYEPSEITIARGEPVVLELVSLDREHGFQIPDLGIRADVKPGETTRVRIVADRPGRHPFQCDVFCGSGHEDMAGVLVVVE
jgi:cytochrome c oxidase subunit 2